MNNTKTFYTINNEDNNLNNNYCLHTQIKQEFDIKSSLLPMQKPIHKKLKFVNKQYNINKYKLNLNNKILKIKNLNLNKNNLKKNINFNYNKQNKKGKNKFKIFNTISENSNRRNNLVFNNTHNKKNMIIKKNNNLNYNNNCNKYRYLYNNHDHLKKELNSNYSKIENFININNSSNSLKSNSIKVNIVKKHCKMITSPILYSYTNTKNNFWKIYQKPKNSCLLNKFSQDYSNNNNETNNNNKDYTKNSNGKSQFISYKKNNFHIFKKNNNNSTYLPNNCLNNIRKDYNTIYNDNTKKENNIIQALNQNKIYQNSDKIYKKNKNIIYENEIRELFSLEKYKTNKENKQINKDKIISNEDIVKLSILRNNFNNQIVKEFSVVVGDETINNNNENENDLNEINSIENKSENISKEFPLSCLNKKTIINVNQYYPSYYISNSNEVMKNIKDESKKEP